jgi:hypothetical protein
MVQSNRESCTASVIHGLKYLLTELAFYLTGVVGVRNIQVFSLFFLLYVGLQTY